MHSILEFAICPFRLSATESRHLTDLTIMICQGLRSLTSLDVANQVMALVRPRGTPLSLSNNDTLFNSTLPASTNSSLPSTLNQPQRSHTPQQSSWFSRLLDHIPGFKWLKLKICQQIYGPTYGLSDVELRKYKMDQIRQARLEDKRRQREAEFKVAKFMAFNHPDFYWHKYIDPFDKGTEERKRGVLLFILTSKEHYNHYYGRRWTYKKRIDEELAEMGIRLDKNIGVKEDTTAEQPDGAVDSKVIPRGLRLENHVDNEIFEKLKKIVEGLDISHLNALQELRSRKLGRRARAFQVWERDNVLQPRLD